MSKYRRSHMGRVFFFTVVTENRDPILTTDLGRQALREAILKVRQDFPFQIVAFVLLPDHLHTVWELPTNDLNYSARWQRIKTAFTKTWRKSGGRMPTRSVSRQVKGEHAIWQRRFYEHTCRDEADLKRCVDYIHINPVKHGLVNCVQDWEWSSFHRYVEAGEYSIDWGNADDWFGDEFQQFE